MCDADGPIGGGQITPTPGDRRSRSQHRKCHGRSARVAMARALPGGLRAYSPRERAPCPGPPHDEPPTADVGQIRNSETKAGYVPFTPQATELSFPRSEKCQFSPSRHADCPSARDAGDLRDELLAGFGDTQPGSDAARGTSNYRVSRNGLTFFSLGTRRSAPRRRPTSPTR